MRIFRMNPDVIALCAAEGINLADLFYPGGVPDEDLVPELITWLQAERPHSGAKDTWTEGLLRECLREGSKASSDTDDLVTLVSGLIPRQMLLLEQDGDLSICPRDGDLYVHSSQLLAAWKNEASSLAPWFRPHDQRPKLGTIRSMLRQLAPDVLPTEVTRQGRRIGNYVRIPWAALKERVDALGLDVEHIRACILSQSLYRAARNRGRQTNTPAELIAWKEELDALRAGPLQGCIVKLAPMVHLVSTTRNADHDLRPTLTPPAAA